MLLEPLYGRLYFKAMDGTYHPSVKEVLKHNDLYRRNHPSEFAPPVTVTNAYYA